MSIADKLDQIIELLTRIESKLDPKPDRPFAVAETTKVAKPTPSQLNFKRLIEFAAGMDRTLLFSNIRKNATQYMADRKRDPSWRFSFRPQFTPKIDEKIAKTGAQFYKDLKAWNENYIRVVETEAEQVFQRAVARLTARA
ncbi:hypothetical protein ACFGVS_03215 [Mucilaginibacter sp. AW1-7]|uniref:hypothetical protein n=1 Tax=Mucilaginibacter sp. AW1-7 TaxID=3349874 RepID=UPI003F73DA41